MKGYEGNFGACPAQVHRSCAEGFEMYRMGTHHIFPEKELAQNQHYHRSDVMSHQIQLLYLSVLSGDTCRD